MTPDLPPVTANRSLVARFDQLPAAATPVAGGKGTSLSRMTQAGLPVPPGFVVCAAAFHNLLRGCDGADFIRELTHELDVHDEAALGTASGTLRDFILSQPLPEELNEAIRSAYFGLGRDTLVAVRSSAVSEDGETASFAGQQETYLNVRGFEVVRHRVRECWASFFTPRALFYRSQKGVLADTHMAVVVQEMILAEKSGVMFTMDPVQKRKDHLVIEAILGLGEAMVSGMVTPDHYVIQREDGSLVREFVAMQSLALVYDRDTEATKEVELPEEQGGARVLSNDELNALREMGLRLEAFFGQPQDVEWCIGQGGLFLLQSRPITTL